MVMRPRFAGASSCVGVGSAGCRSADGAEAGAEGVDVGAEGGELSGVGGLLGLERGDEGGEVSNLVRGGLAAEETEAGLDAGGEGG